MMELTSFPVNPGVFSRIYRWSDRTVCVAYHTPSRSVNLLEGDSAEVWWRIFEAKGATESAIAYMLAQGEFGEDAHNSALATLNEFRLGLENSNLIQGPGNHAPNCGLTETVVDFTSPERNPQHAIGQLMADRHVFYTLTLETTYRCNEKCVHCYLPEDTHLQELTLAQIDQLFAEFYSLGGFQLVLTGGEVAVRKDFIEIINLAKKYGFVTSILSNLTRLSDAMIANIIGHYPKSVSCSMYAAQPEDHDAVTRLQGSFHRSLKAIQTLTNAGVPVAIKTPLMKQTAKGWREVEALAKRLGCGFQMDLHITAKNDGGLSPLAQRIEDAEMIHEVFSSPLYQITIMNEPLQNDTTPDLTANLCGAGSNGLVVSPDGTIRPCIGMGESIGQFPMNSLSSIWHESPFFKRWSLLTLADVPCGRCTFFSTCSRCPGAWHAEHGSYTQPTNYNCFLARAWSSASQAESVS